MTEFDFDGESRPIVYVNGIETNDFIFENGKAILNQKEKLWDKPDLLSALLRWLGRKTRNKWIENAGKGFDVVMQYTWAKKG